MKKSTLLSSLLLMASIALQPQAQPTRRACVQGGRVQAVISLRLPI